MDNNTIEKEFMNDIQLRGWSKWTLKSCKYTLNTFKEAIKEKPFPDVDNNDLKQFLIFLKMRKGRNGEISLETLRKHINNLSSFYEFLEDEEYIIKSPVPKFRRKYLSKTLRNGSNGQKRQIIDLSQMRILIGSILDPQDRAMYTLLAKTGVRAQELMSIDISDMSLDDLSITLKPTGKRKIMMVFFDFETKNLLRRWVDMRGEIASKEEKALFVTNNGTRMSHTILNKRLKIYAELVGLHDPESTDLEKRFTTHCFRHFFTTNLLNSGMPRDYVKELRGDSRSETIDIYNHILPGELKRAYLQHIPRFNI
ncbi:MAG: tyrosine-type recombinase/integrase [Thermoplasmata archaeon]|nr:tyrosine-type recombinase/integrase [Thermoplasmata archaeon]